MSFEELKFMKYVSISDLASYLNLNYEAMYGIYKRGNTNLVRISFKRKEQTFNRFSGRTNKQIFFTGESAYNYVKDQLVDKA